jgi:hypothetical protein
MAWGGSAVFTSWAFSAVSNTGFTKGRWATGAPQVMQRLRLALFNDQVTPDRTAGAASAAYGQGTWTRDREVTSPAAGAWPDGGIFFPLTDADPAGQAYKYLFPQPNPFTVPGVTMAGACGDLLYDPDFAYLGQAFHDYGGTVNIADGLFTVTWAAPPGCIAIGV